MRLFLTRLVYSAERAGFEPAVPLPVRQFSKLFLSATQAPLQSSSLYSEEVANIVIQTCLQKKFTLFVDNLYAHDRCSSASS